MAEKNRKPNQVRHTLTSMYRLLKANPLLKYQLKGEPVFENNETTLLTEFKDKVPDKLLPKIVTASAPPPLKDINTAAVPKVNKKPTLVRTQSARPAAKKPVVKQQQKPPARKVAPTKTTLNSNKNKKLETKQPEKKVVETKTSQQPKKFEFKTPISYKRRSTIFGTPNSCLLGADNTRKPSFASTPGPSAYDLQKRLNDWLKRRGKPIKSFDSLKQFGIKHDTVSKNEENKENIEVEPEKDASYEDLKIIIKEEAEEIKNQVEDEVKVEEDLQAIAKDALKDLKTLILEGYPREQCESWLSAIREKYKNLEEDPLYWECLAALEETVGHISNAVEYYKTAIVHGAEVKDVDESLEQMLEKFSLLNIDSTEKPENDPTKPKYDRNKVVLAARNVFKSSIIQFAIEERKQKKCKNAMLDTIAEEKKRLVVITPVRRSTRRRTGYVITPNVEFCSSVDKLKENCDADVEFRHNQNLAAKFF